MDLLPDELLHDVLRRVPPRHLAACRRVCRIWRAAIDAGLLLLSHLAPRPPRGIFINFFGVRYRRPGASSFFSLDSSSIGVSRRLPRPLAGCTLVTGHQNGLLLYTNGIDVHVRNPATRRWAAPPPPPSPPRTLYDHSCLYIAFDPTLSLHYQLLYFPVAPGRPYPPPPPGERPPRKGSRMLRSHRHERNLPPDMRAEYEREVDAAGSMEWPPAAAYRVQVFSSATGRWQERCFVRQGDAAATAADVWKDPHGPPGFNFHLHHAACWRGEFYLHCPGGFVTRLSLLDQKYHVIKTPTFDNFVSGPTSCTTDGYDDKPYEYLGKSKLGVYYTVVRGYQLSTWLLQEASSDDTGGRTLWWELRHQDDLEPSFHRYHNDLELHPKGDEGGKSWTLLHPREEEDGDRADHGCMKAHIKCYYGMDFLGYHPDEEIVFLGNRYDGFAYDLGTSKLQFLWSLFPNDLYHIPRAAPTLESFIYTPCIDDLLPARNDPW